MAHSNDSHSTDDPYNLSRFLRAQEDDYEQALSEIRGGRKRTHWMWYIFPQLDGLAFSSTSKHYAIKSIEEARAYLAHPVLGPRLLECAEAAVRVEGRTAREVFGSPDDLKFRSCLTLFHQAASADSDRALFTEALNQFYRGQADARTLELLG